MGSSPFESHLANGIFFIFASGCLKDGEKDRLTVPKNLSALELDDFLKERCPLLVGVSWHYSKADNHGSITEIDARTPAAMYQTCKRQSVYVVPTTRIILVCGLNYFI